MLLKETYFTCKYTYRLNVKELKKLFHKNGNQKHTEITNSRQKRLYIKNTKRGKEHYIIINGSI